jgi:hypothetical protein
MPEHLGHGHTATHRIHLLIHSDTRAARSLCGEPPGNPKGWPSGELCIRVPPDRHLPAVVNCPACIARYQELMRCRP